MEIINRKNDREYNHGLGKVIKPSEVREHLKRIEGETGRRIEQVEGRQRQEAPKSSYRETERERREIGQILDKGGVHGA